MNPHLLDTEKEKDYKITLKAKELNLI